MEQRMHMTPRLRTILQQVPHGARLADIGTDHALIPTALLRRGVITYGVASDIRVGPLESAARTAEQFGQHIDLRLGAGLRTVQPEEVDVIVIAGMSGETIVQILEEDAWALDGAHLLLLQPMTAQPQLRQYLAAHGGRIQKESLCREGRRMYTILTVRGGAPCEQKTLAQCCISEALLRDKLAADYMNKLLLRERKIVSSLESARRQKPAELELHRKNVHVLELALAQLKRE